LSGDLYAGLSSAANSNVSLDDARIIPAADLPEELTTRDGIAVAADAFDSVDREVASILDGRRVADGDDQQWAVISGEAEVDTESGVLEQSGNLHAVVEAEAGQRTVRATFNLGDEGKSFGIYVRSEGPDGSGVLFAFDGGLNSWILVDGDDDIIWSSGANAEIIEDEAEIQLTVIDRGSHVRLIANGVDLAGDSWIPVDEREGAAWTGIYSGANDDSVIDKFEVWPSTVQLTDAFDAKRPAPDEDEPIARDSFDVPDGTELDGRLLESGG
jgi:hypothetical protein